jgi:drug/metabolite transporter (DMT)-like permease
LEASIADVETHGLIRAGMASIGMTITVMLASRILARVDSQVMAFYSSGVTSAIYVVVAMTMGAATAPASFAGWAALIAMPLVYTFGLLGWYASLRALGTVRASFVSNFEPLFTVLLAAILLGETMSFRQSMGGALVVGAVVAIQWAGWRKASQ